VWQSSWPDTRQFKFGLNLAGGSTEINDFGADVNNSVHLNCSVFTRQVQLGQGTIPGGITNWYKVPNFIQKLAVKDNATKQTHYRPGQTQRVPGS